MATGSIYALAALGFTLLWQASGTINFATGEFVMLPAFSMLAFMSLGAPLILSFFLTLAVATLVLGWGFKRTIVDPMRKFGVMPLVVATIGLSLIMRSGTQIAFGAQALPFPNIFGYEVFDFAGVKVSASDTGGSFRIGWASMRVVRGVHANRGRGDLQSAALGYAGTRTTPP